MVKKNLALQEVRKRYCFNAGLQVSVVGLERALHQYTLEPSEKPFDMKTVPLATQPLTEQRPAGNGKNVNGASKLKPHVLNFSKAILQ